MGLFPYLVETFDGSRRHVLAEFRTLDRARKAARLSVDSPKVTLAVVRDSEGVMVYATDGVKTWTAEDSPYSEFAAPTYG